MKDGPSDVEEAHGPFLVLIPVLVLHEDSACDVFLCGFSLRFSRSPEYNPPVSSNGVLRGHMLQ